MLGYQVRGELPIQSCKAVLEKVKFLDNPSKEELASCFADVVTQIAQYVRLSNTFFEDLTVLYSFILQLTMTGDHRSRLTKVVSIFTF